MKIISGILKLNTPHSSTCFVEKVGWQSSASLTTNNRKMTIVKHVRHLFRSWKGIGRWFRRKIQTKEIAPHLQRRAAVHPRTSVLAMPIPGAVVFGEVGERSRNYRWESEGKLNIIYLPEFRRHFPICFAIFHFFENVENFIENVEKLSYHPVSIIAIYSNCGQNLAK